MVLHSRWFGPELGELATNRHKLSEFGADGRVVAEGVRVSMVAAVKRPGVGGWRAHAAVFYAPRLPKKRHERGG